MINYKYFNIGFTAIDNACRYLSSFGECAYLVVDENNDLLGYSFYENHSGNVNALAFETAIPFDGSTVFEEMDTMLTEKVSGYDLGCIRISGSVPNFRYGPDGTGLDRFFLTASGGVDLSLET